MAQTSTLLTLRTAAYRRADLEDTNFITDAEATSYINAAISELHDLLVTQYEDYFQSSEDITLVSGAESYAVPTEFYKLLAVFYKSGTNRRRLDRFNIDELADYTDELLSASGGYYFRYRIVGQNFILTPVPTAGGTLEVWYVPQATILVDDGDTLAVGFVSGWEEFVITDAAIQMLVKEESDPQALYARKAELKNRIVKAAAVRDAYKPQKVTDAIYDSRSRQGWR